MKKARNIDKIKVIYLYEGYLMPMSVLCPSKFLFHHEGQFVPFFDRPKYKR